MVYQIGIGSASRLLGVSVSTLKRLCDENLVSSSRTPGGHRRFDLNDIQLLHRRLENAAALPVADSIAQWQDQVFTWLLAGQPQAIEQFVTQKTRSHQPLPAVIDCYLAPALARLAKAPDISPPRKSLAMQRASRLASKLNHPLHARPNASPKIIGCSLAGAHDQIVSRLVEAALRATNCVALHIGCIDHLTELANIANHLQVHTVWLAGICSGSSHPWHEASAALRSQLPAAVNLILYGCQPLSLQTQLDSNLEMCTSLQTLCQRVLSTEHV